MVDIIGFRLIARTTAVTALGCILTCSVFADVYGRLRIVVKNAADEKPIAQAKITLKDSANVRADIVLISDDKGMVLTAPLETRSWKVITEADTFETDRRDVAVIADTTIDVEVLVEPLKEKVIKITGSRNLVNQTQTVQATVRTSQFQEKYPVTVANPQSLSTYLESTPGIAADSVGQAHPRGEHSATTIYINGFQLPNAFQGRAGQVLDPSAIQSVDVLTGGYAPEYGSETAAILNVNLKSGPIQPFANYTLQGGGYETAFGALTFGGQLGSGSSSGDQPTANRFRYLFDISARTTKNALEPPQPDDQTAHNMGTSYTSFGNLEYLASPKDTFSLVASANPAQTQIANRTGLPDSYAPYGQGFGYGGQQPASSGLPSQQALGQDVNQTDHDEFAVLGWRHTFNDTTAGFFSAGVTHAGLGISNNDPLSVVNFNAGTIPDDSSIEFGPQINKNSHNTEIQGSVTKTNRHDTAKAGFVYQGQEGDETYQFVAGSQIALDNLYATDPRLVPQNGTLTGALDSQGNQEYILNPGETTLDAPTLVVHRQGYYAAAYAQDTLRMGRFTANYGLRMDAYHQNESAYTTAAPTQTATVNDLRYSPRLNLSYGIAPKTVLRGSFNQLFIQPNLSQGTILGTQIQPERLKQYDLSIEKQIALDQTVKLAVYRKDITNQIDTGLLLPLTQIGAQVSDQFTADIVKGTEVSYDLSPRGGTGVGGYVSWANSLAKPSGFINGDPTAPAPTYNDHDQLNTISAGVNYTLSDGQEFGANLYYGSGVASSPLADGLPRQPRSNVSVQYKTKSFMQHYSLQLAVSNLFDDESRINFQSGFSGTRFQQGRLISLALNGKY